MDKFEWDLGETRNCPEDFATSYARDLALPPQFMYQIISTELNVYFLIDLR